MKWFVSYWDKYLMLNVFFVNYVSEGNGEKKKGFWNFWYELN